MRMNKEKKDIHSQSLFPGIKHGRSGIEPNKK